MAPALQQLAVVWVQVEGVRVAAVLGVVVVVWVEEVEEVLCGVEEVLLEGAPSIRFIKLKKKNKTNYLLCRPYPF